ncbi:MAG TPA: prepilin-type N-terminal cleavage/methylation domain-containing protein [Fimbriiglobus sp.]|jgi:prepilin-type N-terminal cleavage/methylation domain-containing protein
MRRRRSGFTLLEIIIVLAILIILGMMLLPTLAGIRGKSGVRAGADTVRSQMFEARSRAMGDGVPYRLSLSDDGMTLQVAPDDPNAVSDGTHMTTSEEKMPTGIVASVSAQDGTGSAATVDPSGLIRVATFMPDGTCRENLVEVVVSETGSSVAPITIRIRGVTGAIRTVKTTGTTGPDTTGTTQ